MKNRTLDVRLAPRHSLDAVVTGLTIGAIAGALIFGRRRRRRVPPGMLTPIELYQNIWARTAEYFYDSHRLQGWTAWKHKFDGKIHSDGEAIDYANVMLASLNDRYTYAMTPAAKQKDDEASEDPLAVRATRISDQVGYIKIATFSASDVVAQLESALLNLFKRDRITPVNAPSDLAELDLPGGPEGLIIDLRGNGGGWIYEAVTAASLFVREGPIVTLDARIAGGVLEVEQIELERKRILSTFRLEETGAMRVDERERKPCIAWGKRLAILVDGETASAAELFAAALKHNTGARIFGCRTRGKGIGQQLLSIGEQAWLNVTHLNYYTPAGVWFGDGGQLVSNGIVPDQIVAGSTGGDAAADDDGLLIAALLWLMKGLSARRL
ncbi:MAG TPA: S41 family peptidase [Candidatus Obscuribacterales bacterium]